jgi:hypothetical protein
VSNDRPIIKPGGFFSSTILEYLIETLPMNWSVKRTYSDALWLKAQLEKQFPGFLVVLL